SDCQRILGARGLAQVKAWPGAIMPALEKLVSIAALSWRSITSTSCPSRARKYAVVVPMMPAPSTRIFMSPSVRQNSRGLDLDQQPRHRQGGDRHQGGGDARLREIAREGLADRLHVAN